MSECCKSCGSIDFKETTMPAGFVHYSKIECKDCGKFVKWGKKPRENTESNNNYTGGQSKMNKSILMGRLTKDPELRYTSGNNTAVCSFTLAVDRAYKQDGQPEADFIPVVAWSKLGETCGKYLEKGRRIIIVGRIQTRSWDDTEGKKHYVTEIVAEEMHFADDKKKEGSSSNQGQGQQSGQSGSQSSGNPLQGGQPGGAGGSGGSEGGNLPPWMT